MRNHRLVAATLLCCLLLPAYARPADWPQWRGPLRDGICTETGLLKEWPEGGPTLLRTLEGIGRGWSSPSIVDGRIYITGLVGDRLKLFCYTVAGERVWEADHGPAFMSPFPGSRAEPTIVGTSLYLLSGMGRLAAFRIRDGSELWSVDIAERFGAKVPDFGYSECLLVDDGKVYCTPGGPDAALAALDVKTGETVWTSRGLSHPAAYSQPIAFDCRGVRQISTITLKSVVGVRADNGQFLWHYDRPCNNRGGHIATPVFDDNMVFAASSYDCGGGAARLVEKDGQWSAEQVWDTTAMRAHTGGYVLVDGYLYGNDDAKGWSCFNFKTGAHQWTQRGVGKGSVLYADGMLYTLGERGAMGLAPASPNEHQLAGQFKLPDLAERSEWTREDRLSWAHPVISDGLLYLRSMNRLYVYDIRKR